MNEENTHSDRIRVLFYSHTGLVSGAEQILLNTLRTLDSSLFHTVVLCPADGDLMERLEALSIPVLTVDTLQARFTSSPFALLRYLRSFYQVMTTFRSLARSQAPAIIHANSVRASIVARIATAGMKIPVLWHIHDDLPSHPISSLIRCLAFVSKRDIFVSVSRSTARIFCGRLPFGGRSHVLYNGIDLARFPAKSTTASLFRDMLSIADGDFLVCAVGMINPRKDLLGLLHAFRLVHQQAPNAHLAIVGSPIFNRDDLYLDELKRLTTALQLTSVVHFTGPQKDVPALLRASDLLVLNATVEPFGLVLVEAMSSGTPVMAARVGGIPEIVTDNVTGFLVAPSDPHALAARILDVMADPDMRSSVCLEAEKFCPRFSLQRYSADYRRLLLDHIPRNGNPRRAIPATQRGDLRVALFHDNFAQSGGAEGVAEGLHRTLRSAYPGIDLHSTLTAEERLSPYLREVAIQNTWMQWLPARAKLFRAYFLLYPFAVDRVDLTAYDLIVTSCFGYAKGVRRRPGALHICYCHTPMRWVWRTHDYLSREANSRLKQLCLALPLRWLKSWELQAAARPDLYIANSSVVADRLFQAFGISASVIHPPIDTKRFAPPPGLPEQCTEDFYLVLSRLVPYKRLDLAVEACTRTARRLVVIGDGPDRRRLEEMAGPTVTFLGRASNEVVIRHAQSCRALLFPGEEDFGMTPLEINAAGRPVVAYRGGGAVETVVQGLNGVFFDDPDVTSIIGAINRLESASWDSSAIQRHAQKYDSSVFSERIHAFVEQALRSHAALPELSLSLVTTS